MGILFADDPSRRFSTAAPSMVAADGGAWWASDPIVSPAAQANPFDRFDPPRQANPLDRFDAPAQGQRVTDPALLAQLNAPDQAQGRRVTDPNLIAQLDAAPSQGGGRYKLVPVESDPFAEFADAPGVTNPKPYRLQPVDHDPWAEFKPASSGPLDKIKSAFSSKRSPTFEIQGADGATYEVEAPDQKSEMDAYQRMVGSKPGVGGNAGGKFWEGDPVVSPALGAALGAAPATPAATLPVYDAMGNVTGYEQPAAPVNAMSYGEQMRNVGRVGADTLRATDEMVRQAANGATFGVADKLAANANYALGWAPNYDEALQIERGRTDSFAANHPVAAFVGHTAGGAAGMAAAAGLGLPVFGGTGNVITQAIKGGASMAGLGASAGAINADGDDDARLRGAVRRAVEQGAVGLAGPLAGSALGFAGRMIARPFTGYLAPEATAASRVASAIQQSGRSADEVADAMALASREGQPMFTVADALGNPGQRALNWGTKAPGAGRTEAVEFLEGRQAGQARRVGNAIDEGFATGGQTAAQTEAALTARRAEDAARNYGAAREGAGPVNVSPVIDRADAILQPGVQGVVSPGAGFAPNSIEKAVADARSLLVGENGSQVIDFNRLSLAKRNLDGMIGEASRKGNGAVAEMLAPLRKELDDALAAASPRYAGARDAYAQQSRTIEAVGQGRQAAVRGRTEDTIPAFQALAPEAQQAFRSGYADEYIRALQGTPAGTNAARPLTSQAVREEFPAFAVPGRAEHMMRQLEREGTMYATRGHAIGGSPTAENIADMSAGDVAGTIGRLLSGDFGAALRGGAGIVGRMATGSTEASREALVKALLNTNSEAFRQTMAERATQEMRRKLIAQALARATTSAGVGIVREKLQGR